MAIVRGQVLGHRRVAQHDGEAIEPRGEVRAGVGRRQEDHRCSLVRDRAPLGHRLVLRLAQQLLDHQTTEAVADEHDRAFADPSRAKHGQHLLAPLDQWHTPTEPPRRAGFVFERMDGDVGELVRQPEWPGVARLIVVVPPGGKWITSQAMDEDDIGLGIVGFVNRMQLAHQPALQCDKMHVVSVASEGSRFAPMRQQPGRCDRWRESGDSRRMEIHWRLRKFLPRSDMQKHAIWNG